MLSICAAFFGHLNMMNVRYCHWKSNIRLDEALEGKTDLDILVHKDDRDRFESALKEFGFKKILSPVEKQFPGLEDYLGFDYDTGRLVHLHVHYNLILGQRYIKNHHLPIENLVLQNLTARDDVCIPCPELELIMLIIRAHMKLDVVSIIKQIVKDLSQDPYTPFPDQIEKELDDLIHKVDMDRLKELLQQSRLPLPEELFIGFIARYSARKLRASGIISDCRRIFSGLKAFRRRTSLGIYLEYVYRALWDLPGMGRFKPTKKKTLPGHGRVFALVGADGSGKSTLIEDIEKWLSWKLSVRRIYYGIPKNKLVEITARLIHGLRKIRLDKLASLLDACLWILIARNRYVLSLKAWEGSAMGEIVISDRFPLKEFHQMAEPMDGPRLKDLEIPAGLSLSSLEGHYYKEIKLPDRIFVLKVALDEIRKRKTDLDIETHETKVDAVNLLQNNNYLVSVNANEPYEKVLLKVKTMIWDEL